MSASPVAERIRRENIELFAGPFGRVYSFYMERPWLSRLISRVVWGADVRPYYSNMERIGELPPGATVLDVPCGAGAAFRGVRPGHDLRYIALDLSPDMLRRARKRAAARGLTQIELVEGDAEATGVPGESVDLLLSYWGLHCFPDPGAALAEAARTLRPGGRLEGCCFVGGETRRQRFLAKHSEVDELPREEQLSAWLGSGAGWESAEISRSGPFAFFSADKPA